MADASCPASIRWLRRISDSPTLRATVLVVPAELEVAGIRDLACETLNLQLTERRHWLRLLPDELTCTLVTNEAASYRALNFVVSPAWAHDMIPLSGTDEPVQIRSFDEEER